MLSVQTGVSFTRHEACTVAPRARAAFAMRSVAQAEAATRLSRAEDCWSLILKLGPGEHELANLSNSRG